MTKTEVVAMVAAVATTAVGAAFAMFLMTDRVVVGLEHVAKWIDSGMGAH